MTALLLLWVLFADGSVNAYQYPRANVIVCEDSRELARQEVLRIAATHPGTIRMFAVLCAAPEAPSAPSPGKRGSEPRDPRFIL